MRLLYDEEIDAIITKEGWSGGGGKLDKILIKAQHQLDLKLIIEWGDEPCFDHEAEFNRMIEREFGIGSVTIRRACPECWQSLKQLVEE